MQRFYLRVSGQVQGVGFRYFVKYTAELFGLTGWVRNREDGDVELEVQGTKENTDPFIESVRQGNRYSEVREVTLRSIEPIREYGFEIDTDTCG